MQKIEIDPRSVKIPDNVLKAILGFGKIKEIPDEFRTHVQKAYEELLKVARPVVVWEDFKVKDSLSFNDIELTGELVEKHLKGSKIITVLLATLGKEVDNKIEEFFREGNDLLGFFIDSIASEMVEYALRMVDSNLRIERSDMEGSFRISPGYGDLPISLNKKIAELFKGVVDVEIIEDSYILIPRKTITAFIGWREKNEKEK
ncbi:methionine synthase [Thermotoga sp. KOL6]|uniref:methionine synthase n=1 Tax=Thermotoga sp. KOL6 TaxID=126741 RepID=UPI000C7602AF|nr:methionine synthase [Thermotoga sp. KOL6]PLV59023.1 methionine synthase [Thermotoga sp. KOL6]